MTCLAVALDPSLERFWHLTSHQRDVSEVGKRVIIRDTCF
jgi:hypothetical protein